MSTETEQQGQAVQAPPRRAGQIEVRKLSFRYDPHGPWILCDIAFTVRPGQKVALVGATAAGKSTRARLLLGLYPPTAGEIRYDGLPPGGSALRRRAPAVGGGAPRALSL